MIDAPRDLGFAAVGLIDQPPLWANSTTVSIFTDTATDLRPANAVAEQSPTRSRGYFRRRDRASPTGADVARRQGRAAGRGD
jgi:hypothetical protein